MPNTSYTVDEHGFHTGKTLETIRANCSRFAEAHGFKIGEGFLSGETEADYCLAQDNDRNFFYIDMNSLEVTGAEHNGVFIR